jgi:hypothetical protein
MMAQGSAITAYLPIDGEKSTLRLSWKAVNPTLGLLQSLSFRKWERAEGMLPKDRQIRAGRMDADKPIIPYLLGFNFVTAIFGRLSNESRHTDKDSDAFVRSRTKSIEHNYYSAAST